MVKLGQQAKGNQVLTRTARLRQREATIFDGQQKVQIAEGRARLTQAKTLEEYKTIYDSLTPFQKQSFKSPQEMEYEAGEERNAEITRINVDIQNANSEKQRLSSKIESGQLSPRESREVDEQVQFYQGYIDALEEGKSKIQKGEADYDSVIDYAQTRGESKSTMRRERFRNIDSSKERAKEIERIQNEAINRGFVQTGMIEEYEGDKVKSTEFYVGGRQVSGKEFSKKVDTEDLMRRFAIAQSIQDASKESKQIKEPALVEAPVTTPQEESPQETKGFYGTFFPLEKEFFKNLLKNTTYQRGVISDVVSSAIPTSTVTFGDKPTTMPREDIVKRRDDIRMDYLRGLFGRDANNLYKAGIIVEGIKELKNKPSSNVEADQSINLGKTLVKGIIDNSQGSSILNVYGSQEARIKTFQARREARKGSIEAVPLIAEVQKLNPVIDIQSSAINGAVEKLDSLNERTDAINKRLGYQNISPSEQKALLKEDETIKAERLVIFNTLSDKGVKTTITPSTGGSSSIDFSSPELTRGNELSKYDFGSIEMKQWEGLTNKQRYSQEAGIVARDITYTALISAIPLGATGAYTKLGNVISKGAKYTQPIVKSIPVVSVLGTKTGVIALTSGLIGTNIGMKGYSKGKMFQSYGLPFSEGLVYGIVRESAVTTGLILGGQVGSSYYTKSQLTKVSQGSFTKPLRSPPPSQIRGGRIITKGGKTTKLNIQQRDLLKTTFPSSDIYAKTDRKIVYDYPKTIKNLKWKKTVPFEKNKDVAYNIKRLSESGKISFKMKQVKVPVMRGDVNLNTQYYQGAKKIGQTKVLGVIQDNKDGASLFLARETKGGVMISGQRLRTKINAIKLLSRRELRTSSVEDLFIDFQSGSTKVGKSVFLPNEKLFSTRAVDKQDAVIRLLRKTNPTAFATRSGGVTYYPQTPKTYSRVQQVTRIVRFTDGESQGQIFVTRASERTADMKLLKNLLKNNILVANKRGQVSLASSSPSNVNTNNPLTEELSRGGSVNVKPFYPSTLSGGELQTITTDLSGIYGKAISRSTFIGSLVAIPSKDILKDKIRYFQEGARRTELNRGNIREIQFEDTTTKQVQPSRTRQTQGSSVRQIMQQISSMDTAVIQFQGMGSPTPRTPKPFLPPMDLFNNEKLLKAIKKKKGSKDVAQFAYLPDFTAKVVGLPNMDISMKQANKQTRKILSGLEIRQGVRIR